MHFEDRTVRKGWTVYLVVYALLAAWFFVIAFTGSNVLWMAISLLLAAATAFLYRGVLGQERPSGGWRLAQMAAALLLVALCGLVLYFSPSMGRLLGPHMQWAIVGGVLFQLPMVVVLSLHSMKRSAKV